MCTFAMTNLSGPLLCAQEWLSEAELGQTFENYDADHSGAICFDEFVHMVCCCQAELSRLMSAIMLLCHFDFALMRRSTSK